MIITIMKTLIIINIAIFMRYFQKPKGISDKNNQTHTHTETHTYTHTHTQTHTHTNKKKIKNFKKRTN